MMNQTYYDYQLKPVIQTMEKNESEALFAVITSNPDNSNPHASTWISISANQLKAILKVLNTTI